MSDKPILPPGPFESVDLKVALEERYLAYALSTITAVAGVGVGAWLVLAAPDAPTPAPAIETASVSDFQGNAHGATALRSISTDNQALAKGKALVWKPVEVLKPEASYE